MRVRHRCSLTTLRTFETLARVGSFAGAARELEVTRPAVSKQIRLLEEALSCRLLDRSPVGCQLTAEGRELYGGLDQAFNLIAATTEGVADRARYERKVKVLVERDFATAWLAQSIGSFLLDNPGISVEIVAEPNGRLNLNESYSFRIFYGARNCFENEQFFGEALCGWVDLPVCTAEYAQRHLGDGQFKEVHILLDSNYNPWELWFSVAGMDAAIVRATHSTFNGTTLCLSAAMASAGLTIGCDSFVGMAAIESGHLVAPIPIGMRSVETFTLYRSKSVRLSAAEKSFREWLLKSLAEYDAQVEAKLAALGILILEPPVQNSRKGQWPQ
ncbi:MAG: LysR family transcriptional regulator [Mesorhizobium sp.]|nr:MAG: LysR family transcriptional regulator [Mesorhizobium sp.]